MAYASYIIHYGIRGQQWGVRRFQNEDGSLTEEGRKRYLKKYDMLIDEANEEIKGAQHQIRDIEQNGWKAKSAFTSTFVKQLKKAGILDDPEQSAYNLNTFKNVFKQDLKEAKLKKQSAEEARSFIEKNLNVTYDDVLRESIKTDNKNKTNIEEHSREVGNKLGLKEKTSKINIYSDDKTLKAIKKKFSKEDMNDLVSQARAAIKKQVGKDMLFSMNVNGVPFKDIPLEQQVLIIVQMFNVKEI